MSTVADLKEQLANQIRAAITPAAYVDIQVEPRMVPNPSPPTIDIYPAAIATDPQTAGFGDLDGAYLFTVRARVQESDPDANQDLLDEFYDNESSLSLQVAIEADTTLGGWAIQAFVVDGSKTGYAVYDELVGFQLTVFVENAPS